MCRSWSGRRLGARPTTAIPAVNAAVRQVVATYPNVSIADWEAFVPDEAVQTDGIHRTRTSCTSRRTSSSRS